MEKYKFLLQEINIAINKFNLILNTIYSVPLLNENDFSNKEFFTDLNSTKWDDQRWPNSDKSGVYFIFGKNQANQTEYGLYIGKASLSSKIGGRLYSHLTSYRNQENYLMNDGRGKTYILELISSITLENNNMSFMTPAFEEFLLIELRDKINLINVYGNY